MQPAEPAVTRERSIPEATVGRLPVYLRALVEMAGSGTTTVSSEELAEAAGVNSAKVRKDLSHLGSYGTRGVGYDVAYLIHQIRRELGLTQDWAIVIVGHRQPGPRPGELRGFAERGFRVAALVDADPVEGGGAWSAAHGPPRRRPARAGGGARAIAIGVIATPAAAVQEVADRMVAAGIRSILNFAPAVIAVAARRVGAQGGPGGRAADPGVLRAAEGDARRGQAARRAPMRGP